MSPFHYNLEMERRDILNDLIQNVCEKDESALWNNNISTRLGQYPKAKAAAK